MLVSIAAFVVATYIDSLKPGIECFPDTGEVTPACQRALDKYWGAQQSLGALLGTADADPDIGHRRCSSACRSSGARSSAARPGWPGR